MRPDDANGSSAYYVTYQYDAMNCMTEINQNGSTTTPLVKYQWDALSRMTQITYGDSTSDAYSQYDAGDNLQTLTQNFGGADNSVTFSYTWLMNHQRASVGVSDMAFQFVPTAGTTSYGAADSDNGLTTAGGASMAYDFNHNLTYDGYNTLTYDVENRMVEAENAAWGASQYLYDPLGQRKQKTVGVGSPMPVTTQFVLAGGEEIGDYYAASGTWRLTVRGVGGLPLAAVVPAADGMSEQIAYVHHDVQGSTVALTTAGTSGPAETYTYSDYGAPQSGSWSAYQYAGYRYDSETGLYYVKARYYSPNLGRFMQSDPVGFQGGMNLYAYVGNDPINLLDPMGEGAIVAVRGNNVNITYPVVFYGADATPETVFAYVNQMQSVWTGPFRQYNVTTTVEVTYLGQVSSGYAPYIYSYPTNFVEADSSLLSTTNNGIPYTAGVGGNYMQLNALNPKRRSFRPPDRVLTRDCLRCDFLPECHMASTAIRDRRRIQPRPSSPFTLLSRLHRRILDKDSGGR